MRLVDAVFARIKELMKEKGMSMYRLERRGASVNDCDHPFERNRNFGYNLRCLRRIPDHAARIFRFTAL